MSPVRYDSAETFGVKVVRRRLGDVLNNVVLEILQLPESKYKLAIQAQLRAISEVVRELEVRLLGPDPQKTKVRECQR
jgi:hypothetical protein